MRPRISRRRRGNDFFRNTETVLKTAIEEKCDLIIHGGDLFFRSRIPAPIIDRVYDLLFRYAENGIPIIIVPGNHERSVLPQSVLLGHPNLHIFSEPASFSFFIKGTKITISGFPNIRKGARYGFSKLRNSFTVDDSDLNILLMHQAVDGCRIAGYTFRNDPDTIDINSIPKDFQLVLCGHIHRRQILNHNKQIIIYSGSVERTSFQEKDEPKGYYIISYEKIRNFPEIRFNELPSRPMIDCNVDGIIGESNWEKLMRSKLRSFPDDAIIRLKCKRKLSAQEKQKLSASYLRELLPDTMNYTVSSSIFR